MVMSVIRLPVVLCVLLMVLSLAGCVTEETTSNGQPVPEKVSKEGALQDYITLATGYMGEGKREQALRAINKGLEIDSGSAAMLNVLAYYYTTDSENKLAEQQYKKAIRSDSSYTASYLNYGIFLYRAKRFDEACSMFAKATEDVMYANRDDAFLNYGICLRQQGKMKEAEESLRRSYVNNSRNPGVILELAQLKFETGSFEESQQFYDKFLTMSRQTPKSLWLGIRLMHVAGKEDQLASYALFLKNEFPGSLEYAEYKSWSESR